MQDLSRLRNQKAGGQSWDEAPFLSNSLPTLPLATTTTTKGLAVLDTLKDTGEGQAGNKYLSENNTKAAP